MKDRNRQFAENGWDRAAKEKMGRKNNHRRRQTPPTDWNVFKRQYKDKEFKIERKEAKDGISDGMWVLK